MNKAEKLKAIWKTRKDYIGLDTKTSLYRTWRGIVFTKKGKQKGFPDKWKSFKLFKEDVFNDWAEGKVLIRLDSKKPYSVDNIYWGEKGSECIGNMTRLEFNNETKTLIEWCELFNLNYNGVRQRYFKGKNYTNEQILFGKKKQFNTKIVKDYNSISKEQEKRNKISKMLSSYKNKDNKKGFLFNLTRDWFNNNILGKQCFYCGSLKNIGCDRIDNNKGHSIDNVVPCCNICNTVRGNNFTVDEMKLLGSLIKKIINNRGKK